MHRLILGQDKTTTHEEEVEMCGFLISWTSCPAALISPDHPSLSLSLRRRCNMEVAFEGQTHGFCATNIAPMVLEGQQVLCGLQFTITGVPSHGATHGLTATLPP